MLVVEILVDGGVWCKLAFLRREGQTVFACKPERYEDIKTGRAPAPLTGFNLESVSEHDRKKIYDVKEIAI